MTPPKEGSRKSGNNMKNTVKLAIGSIFEKTMNSFCGDAKTKYYDRNPTP